LIDCSAPSKALKARKKIARGKREARHRWIKITYDFCRATLMVARYGLSNWMERTDARRAS